MKKSEINQIAHALARRAQETRLPMDEVMDLEYGRRRAEEAFRKIRQGTTRSKIRKLIAAE